MKRYVEVTRRARRDLDDLDNDTRELVVAAIISFGSGLRPNADVRRLAGIHPPRYRLRVGRFRVIYVIEAERLVVLRVLDRRDAYR